MRLREQEHTVDTSSGLFELDFDFDEGGKHIIFDVLRSKMYSDPIGSICREVLCNARDSHREAGVTERVRVEIVRPDNPFVAGSEHIVFTDFGVGMSPERVRDVYVKYGASTKRDGNEQTGGFGLGAKTPFSYSDSFTVRTVHGGRYYLYTAYIDDSRTGKVALLDEGDTDEHNGTQVMVPIERDDVAQFADSVLKAIRGWSEEEMPDTCSTIGRPEGIDDKVPGTDRWRWCSNRFPEQATEHSPVTASVDGVLYPVSKEHPDLREISGYHGMTCLLVFGNGELTVSANRERLQYDKRTVAALVERFAEAASGYRRAVIDEVAGARSFMAARGVWLRHRVNKALTDGWTGPPPYLWQGRDVTEFPPGHLRRTVVAVYGPDGKQVGGRKGRFNSLDLHDNHVYGGTSISEYDSRGAVYLEGDRKVSNLAALKAAHPEGFVLIRSHDEPGMPPYGRTDDTKDLPALYNQPYLEARYRDMVRDAEHLSWSGVELRDPHALASPRKAPTKVKPVSTRLKDALVWAGSGHQEWKQVTLGHLMGKATCPLDGGPRRLVQGDAELAWIEYSKWSRADNTLLSVDVHLILVPTRCVGLVRRTGMRHLDAVMSDPSVRNRVILQAVAARVSTKNCRSFLPGLDAAIFRPLRDADVHWGFQVPARLLAMYGFDRTVTRLSAYVLRLAEKINGTKDYLSARRRGLNSRRACVRRKPNLRTR